MKTYQKGFVPALGTPLTKDGDFIGLPQRKGNDGKYYSIVWAKFSEQDTKDILAEVEKKLNS